MLTDAVVRAVVRLPHVAKRLRRWFPRHLLRQKTWLRRRHKPQMEDERAIKAPISLLGKCRASSLRPDIVGRVLTVLRTGNELGNQDRMILAAET